MKRALLFSRVLLPCLYISGYVGIVQAETVVASATLTLTGTVYMTPKCTINNNNPIVVDFGTLKIPELDTVIGPSSSRNRVAKNVPVSCGESATPPLTGYALKMKITPKETAYDSALLGTSNPNLGIYVMAGAPGSEATIMPGTATTMVTDDDVPGNGIGSFIFTPIANSAAKPTAGTFTGSATMTLDYE
jgi:type 1 fimbria pilin